MEAAVQRILPVVILAAEGLRFRCLVYSAIRESIATVLADIEEPTNRAVKLPYEDNRLATDFSDEEIPRVRNVGLAPAEQPNLGPHALPLEPQEVGRGIAARVDHAGSELRVRRLLGRGLRTLARRHSLHRLPRWALRALEELIGRLAHATDPEVPRHSSSRAPQRMPRRRIS